MNRYERTIREFIQARIASAPADQKGAGGKAHLCLELAMYLESEFDIVLSDADVDALGRADTDALLRTVLDRLVPGNRTS